MSHYHLAHAIFSLLDEDCLRSLSNTQQNTLFRYINRVITSKARTVTFKHSLEIKDIYGIVSILSAVIFNHSVHVFVYTREDLAALDYWASIVLKKPPALTSTYHCKYRKLGGFTLREEDFVILVDPHTFPPLYRREFQAFLDIFPNIKIVTFYSSVG
jgi:hypothetical protein